MREEILPLSTDGNPYLRRVIDLWDGLPTSLQSSIVALIEGYRAPAAKAADEVDSPPSSNER